MKDLKKYTGGVAEPESVVCGVCGDCSDNIHQELRCDKCGHEIMVGEHLICEGNWNEDENENYRNKHYCYECERETHDYLMAKSRGEIK